MYILENIATAGNISSFNYYSKQASSACYNNLNYGLGYADFSKISERINEDHNHNHIVGSESYNCNSCVW